MGGMQSTLATMLPIQSGLEKTFALMLASALNWAKHPVTTLLLSRRAFTMDMLISLPVLCVQFEYTPTEQVQNYAIIDK